MKILGGVGPQNPYFDVTAFKPVTEPRFGTAKFNSLRGPGVVNLDMSLIRTIAMSKAVNLQFRLEGFNVTNSPHFANPTSPGNLNVSNLLYNPDGSVKALNGFGVINSTQSAGREYAERYFRLGIRLSF